MTTKQWCEMLKSSALAWYLPLPSQIEFVDSQLVEANNKRAD